MIRSLGPGEQNQWWHTITSRKRSTTGVLALGAASFWGILAVHTDRTTKNLMISPFSDHRKHLVPAAIAVLLLTGCSTPGNATTGFDSRVAPTAPPTSAAEPPTPPDPSAGVASPTVTPPPATSAPEPGDAGVESASHAGTPSPIGTKRATSGLWFNDESWWGNLWDTDSSDFHIFRFDAATSSWVDTGVATDPRASTHHDVLWDGTTLNVASYRFVNDGLPAEPGLPTTMRRYSYNWSTKTYKQLSSTQINNERVEALTIDKDSTGRVWATWQQGNRIYLNATGTDGTTWGTPFPHPASLGPAGLGSVSVDDTSAVIAFDGNKMGVMWSRQVGDATDGRYWSYHVDGASNTSWSPPVAAVLGQNSADDHINLKRLGSSGGRVFAAIKTSFTAASQPLIQLLELNGTTWSAHTIATVAECPNRMIVMIDESTQMLRTFATYPKPGGTANAGVCSSTGGATYEKSTPLDNIDFSAATKTPRIVDADQYVHNATSTKQNVNSAAQGTAGSGLLMLADVNATSRYWQYYDPSSGSGGGDTTDPTVAPTPAAARPV
ncbi:hypothetical protein ACX80H_01130 [Arthrobacter sp. MDT2-2]